MESSFLDSMEGVTPKVKQQTSMSSMLQIKQFYLYLDMFKATILDKTSWDKPKTHSCFSIFRNGNTLSQLPLLSVVLKAWRDNRLPFRCQNNVDKGEKGRTVKIIIMIVDILSHFELSQQFCPRMYTVAAWRLIIKTKIYISKKYFKLSIVIWQEADQLAIYKCGWGVELGSTVKQLLWMIRAALTWTRGPPDFKFSTLITQSGYPPAIWICTSWSYSTSSDV